MTQNFIEPPGSNRGVHLPLSDPCIALVDWFSCTFHDFKTPKELIHFLELEMIDFEVQWKGFNGYKNTITNDKILIAFDGSGDMGLHLNMSGQACRQYEETFKNGFDWQQLFFKMQYTRHNVTRLDLAIDDFTKMLNLNTIYRKAVKKSVVTKFRNVSRYESYDIQKEENTGTTIYFGSPKSEIQIRFYDKKKEREKKNYIIRDDIKTWQRYEIQLRDERATISVKYMSDPGYNLGEFIKSIFKTYLDFKTTEIKDRNHSERLVSCKWWLDFLGEVEKVKLTQKAPDLTIPRIKNWVDRQVVSSVAVLTEVFNKDLLLDYVLKLGHEKMTKEQRKAIKSFQDQEILQRLYRHEMLDYLYGEEMKKESPGQKILL